MPPEAVIEGIYSVQADIWSWGVTVWEIFENGELPHSELSDELVVRSLANGDLETIPPYTAPDEVQKIVDQCWRVKPHERPSFSTIARTMDKICSDSNI